MFLNDWLNNEGKNKKSCFYPLSMEIKKILEVCLQV